MKKKNTRKVSLKKERITSLTVKQIQNLKGGSATIGCNPPVFTPPIGSATCL